LGKCDGSTNGKVDLCIKTAIAPTVVAPLQRRSPSALIKPSPSYACVKIEAQAFDGAL
jgi:hypothetical protein